MTDTLVVGIDPGAHGAIAVLDAAGELLDVFDMPATVEANGRTATNAPLLAANTRSRSCPRRLLRIRRRKADRREGCGVCLWSRSRRHRRGAGALGLPIVFITPPVWKRLADIPPGVENKDLARTRAIARWPAKAELFARKGQVDRAEACLMAMAGLKREGGR